MTYPTFPTLGIPNPTSFDMRLAFNTQSFQSPLNGSVQTMELPGARWKMSATWDMLSPTDRAALIAFMASLRGQAGRFYIWDLWYPTVRGPAGGTPLTASSSTASLIKSSGWPISTTPLLAGDKIAVNHELKVVTADVVANGSGLADISVSPPFRVVPSSGVAIVVTKPSALFKLSSDDQGGSNQMSGGFPVISLTADEAFQ